MQTPESKEILKYDKYLWFLPQGIAEAAGKKAVIFVPAAEIEHITLHYGKSDHRPMVSIALGVVFIVVSVFGLVEFVIAPRGYRYELAMVALGLIGGSFINDALKQRFFLEVHGKNGARRLIF